MKTRLTTTGLATTRVATTGLAALLCLTAAAIAAQAGPATQPADTSTQPADASTQPAFDPSTPRSAAHALFLAVFWGYAQPVGQLCDAPTPAEQTVRAALTRYASSVHTLHDAVAAAFDADAAAQIHPPQPDLAQIDVGQLDVKGESATLTVAGMGAAVPLVRHADGWKVQLGQYCQELDLEPTAYAGLLNRMAHVNRFAAQEVRDRRLITPESVQQFIDDADQAANNVPAAATTAPASTQP